MEGQMKKKKAILNKNMTGHIKMPGALSYCITNAINLLSKSECDLSSLGFDSANVHERKSDSSLRLDKI